MNGVKDDIVGGVFSFVARKVLTAIAPVLGGLPTNPVGLGQSGRKFEGFVSKLVCDAAGMIAGSKVQGWIYQEVVIDRKGKPKTDGYGCSSTKAPQTKLQDVSKPDFVFSPQKPYTEVAKNDGKTFVVGDIKLNMDVESKSDSSRGSFHRQFNNIVAHAKNWTWSHSLVYLSLYPPNDPEVKRLRSRATKNSVVLIILSAKGVH